MVNRNMGGNNPQNPAMPDVNDFLQDHKEKRKLLERWPHYFPHEPIKDFDPNDFKHLCIQVFFEAFSLPEFQQYLEWEKKEDNFENVVVNVNYSNLYSCGNPNIKQFLEYVYEHPNDVIKSIALGLDNVRLFIYGFLDHRVVILRFYNFNQIFPMSMIKSHLINKYICIRGTVLRVSSIKVLVESIQFTCHECKSKIVICFIDGKWETPNRCINIDCRSRIFNPEKHTARTSFYQRLKIQEIENDINDINAGKMPKTIECEIKNDLIDTCISGDIVTICGIMKTEVQSDIKGYAGQINKNRALHMSYIDVNSIKNSNTEYFLQTAISNNPSTSNINDQKVNLAEINMIHKISERKDLFALLVKSICPSIFGNEIVKVGMIMSLFGGTDHRLKMKGEFADIIFGCQENRGENLNQMGEDEFLGEDKVTPTIRPDIHMLVVGDPGLGKSQMLKHLINVTPRGVYVCGNSTTNAGLTATMVRDSVTNEQTLEAGALVLSDLGICCIDEFDKMTSDQSTLLEAMEQQTISIAKGGIMGSLSARCSVVACANPTSGHYNRSRTILENIRVSNAILSRFDMVFLLLDDPDLQRDKKLSEHVMKLHSRNRKRNLNMFEQGKESAVPNQWEEQSKRLKTDPMGFNQSKNSQPTTNLSSGVDESLKDFDKDGMTEQYSSLTQKIKVQCDRIPEHEIIPPNILKKYISYAKHTVFPQLSMEACEMLKDFYISLRENACNNTNTLPITSRCLDSLIRLSQARAKLELRTIVTREDTIDIVKLVQESIFEACYLEMGMNRGGGIYNQGGSMGMSQNIGGRGNKGFQDPNNVSMLSIPKQTKIYVDKLRQEANMRGSPLYDYQELVRIGKDINLQVGDFRTMIDKLNSQGILIMKPGRQYQLAMQ